jgi:four helix bundle protein
MKARTESLDSLHVYRLAEELSDVIWRVVPGWNQFARDTIGKQIIRSADSIGANIAEGVGRWNYRDNRKFIRVARGSLYETRHWLRRACRRELLSEIERREISTILDELIPKLNAYIRSLDRQAGEERIPPSSTTGN